MIEIHDAQAFSDAVIKFLVENDRDQRFRAEGFLTAIIAALELTRQDTPAMVGAINQFKYMAMLANWFPSDAVSVLVQGMNEAMQGDGLDYSDPYPYCARTVRAIQRYTGPLIADRLAHFLKRVVPQEEDQEEDIDLGCLEPDDILKQLESLLGELGLDDED